MLRTAPAKEHGELALPKPDTALLDLPGEQTAVAPVAGAWTVSFPHAFAPNALADGAPETRPIGPLQVRDVGPLDQG